MADERRSLTEEELAAKIINNLSDGARERIINAIARYLAEQEQEERLLQTLRKLS